MNGCFNRLPYVTSYPAPNGHWLDGQTFTIKAASIKTTARRDCQYTLSPLGQKDPGCTGCTWRKDLTQGAPC